MEEKIQQLKYQYEKLGKDLQDPKITSDPQKIQKISQEYNDLGEILATYKQFKEIEKSLKEISQTLKEEKDKDLIQLAQEEWEKLQNPKTQLETKLKLALAPQNPLDKKDIIIEIRAGAGGDEAGLFVANLFRMYSQYAEKQGWKTHLIAAHGTEIGGFKEVIFEICGQNVYSNLKYESGVHRVQRIPQTEKSGRIHTSTATVAVLPEADPVDIEIKPEDLKIETSTSRGHGGQSVNTTYSAIRITYLPSGMMVSCQDERSQHQNRAKALMVLRSRLLAQKEEKGRKKRGETRRSQIGTGDRSEKIRTYNYPQDRITDHRVKKSWSKIQTLLDGNLDPLINSLKMAEQKL